MKITCHEGVEHPWISIEDFYNQQELDFIWNAIRDDATFLKKEQLDTANQKTNLYITAINNEANTAINSTGVADGVKNLIDEMFN